MPFLAEIVVYGMLVPMAVAAALASGLVRRADPSVLRARYALPLGISAGLATSCWLLPWFPSWPTSSWHWLPYLAFPATVMCVAAAASSRGERLVLLLSASAITAAVLVPDFAELAPRRPAWILGGALGGWLLAWNGDEVTAKFPDRLSVLILAGSGLSTAVVAGLSGSTKFAQLAGVIAVCIVAGLAPGQPQHVKGLRAAAAVTLLLLAGLSFTAYFYSYSAIPAASYLLVVAAPLAQWAGACSWLSERARLRAAVRAGGVTLVLAAAVGAALYFEAQQ